MNELCALHTDSLFPAALAAVLSSHQTTTCRKPWRARVCRSTSRPAHPITELPPILSLNLDMSACLWRVETGPVRCRRAVPRSSDEKSSAASAAGKRLSVWIAQSSCNCSDHQTFACLCMRGRRRKLVAIQTEACVCSWGGASACCSEPCGDLLTELLSPVGTKRLTLRMPDKVSETAAWLSA